MSYDERLKKGLYAVLQRMLTPIVRLCIKHSLYLNDLIEILKSVFVQVAKDQLQETAADASVSRISAMSGVHRKDVTRLLHTQSPTRAQASLIGRIMAQWQNDRRFITARGKPRALRAEGKDSEFAKLVALVNGGDISHYSILFEMERKGIVSRRGSRVHLLWRDSVIESNVLDGLTLASQNIKDLAKAVEENLYESAALKNLHLTTTFDKIDQDSLPLIRRWLLEEGSKFHLRARAFLSKHDSDINHSLRNKQCGARVVLGAFSLLENPALSTVSKIQAGYELNHKKEELP